MLGFTFEKRDWPRARRELEAAARAAPSNDVLFYNLGLIYERNGLLDDAVAAFERAHAINPRHLPSGDRPRASDRLAELAAREAPVIRSIGSPALRARRSLLACSRSGLERTIA